MLTMTRTEAIPYESMVEGMLPKWDWETIPEYLDSLERAPLGVNVIQYMPTASLMTYVMGLEAAKTRPATAEERKEMQRLLHEGMDAGLCGFSIQRLGENSTQADFDGSPMVTDTMCDEDILALAEVLAERDEGFIQITQSTGDVKRGPGVPGEAGRGRAAGRSSTTRSSPPPRTPRSTGAACAGSRSAGTRACRSTARPPRCGPATRSPSSTGTSTTPARRGATITTGTKEEKLAKMRDPDLRQAVRATRPRRPTEAPGHPGRRGRQARRGSIVQSVNGQPELEQYVGKSLGQIAKEEGKHHVEVMLDLSVAGDLNVEFLRTGARASTPSSTAEMINDSPYTIPGVSDGGAHTKFFNGGSWTTDFLRWLVRDEAKVTLEEAHYRMSALAAHAAGFKDRGVLREGAAADVVVYDMEELDIEPQLGRRGRPRLPRWRVAPGPAGQGLQGHHRQRRGDLRGRRLHRAPRPASCSATAAPSRCHN